VVGIGEVVEGREVDGVDAHGGAGDGEGGDDPGDGGELCPLWVISVGLIWVEKLSRGGYVGVRS